MWCALLLLALVAGYGGGVAANGGQRYGEYGAVKMPLYSGEYDAPRDLSDADDYRAHSPDVPASPDYKYMEEPKGNTDKSSLKDKEDEIADDWQKPVRNQRRRTRIDNDDYSENLDKHNQDDIFPKFKFSNRFTKHRSRLKFQKSERSTYSRGVNDAKDDNDEGSDLESEDEFSDKRFRETARRLDGDIKYSHKKTTDRIIKRKPRDKERPIHSHEMEDLMISDKRFREDDEGEIDFRKDMIQGRRPAVDRHQLLGEDSDDPRHFFDLDHRRPGSDSDDPRRMLGKERVRLPGVDGYEPGPLQRPRDKEKTKLNEYDDFYDMKRVLDVKNRLPDLVRRTKARGAAPRPMEELEEFFSNRRAFEPAKSAPSVPSTSPTTSTIVIAISEHSSRHLPSTTTTTTTTTTTEPTITETKGELSMAEKSRLSILKKILKKESERNGPPIQKPAVLLQVTKKLPTVVMVEPVTKREPWMRAREVAEDSPSRVERAKQLMRHKLVANAKNIHDLTDNWDETICEYIDVSLLDEMSAAPRAPAHSLVLIIYSVCYFVFVTVCEY